MKETDTIAGIATPLGEGGIGIVRISGEAAFEVLSQIFTCKAETMEDRKLYLGRLRAEGFFDQCLAVRFPAPLSYTGENVAELHCHGGNALVGGALSAVLASGARLAENGEFTKRAFLNGKVTLSGAEGIADMIHARSEAELNAAYTLLRGRLNREAKAIQEEITDLISRVEVLLDYPEEEVQPAEIRSALRKAGERLAALEKSCAAGRLLREGLTVAVVGCPNVGKSSLMNRLLNYDRAIVTEEAGTTRDTLETPCTIRGIRVNLVDTAGIRDAQSPAERQGVERSREIIRTADTVLLVVDGTRPPAASEREIAALAEGKRIILAVNKSDLPGFRAERYGKLCKAEVFPVSALNGGGMEKLKDSIVREMGEQVQSSDGFLLTNERHADAVRRARQAVDSALIACDSQMLDGVAMEIRRIWDTLGEITGTTATEAILDNIFSKFCLGK